MYLLLELVFICVSLVLGVKIMSRGRVWHAEIRRTAVFRTKI